MKVHHCNPSTFQLPSMAWLVKQNGRFFCLWLTHQVSEFNFALFFGLLLFAFVYNPLRSIILPLLTKLLHTNGVWCDDSDRWHLFALLAWSLWFRSWSDFPFIAFFGYCITSNSTPFCLWFWLIFLLHLIDKADKVNFKLVWASWAKPKAETNLANLLFGLRPKIESSWSFSQFLGSD